MGKKSLKQSAVDFAGNREKGYGHGYPSATANLLEKGFLEGAKFAKKRMYTEEDMLEAAKYGYDYHNTTSFPEQSFEENCVRNTLQWMNKFSKKNFNNFIKKFKDVGN